MTSINLNHLFYCNMGNHRDNTNLVVRPSNISLDVLTDCHTYMLILFFHYEVQRIPLDDERIAFRMLEALDFEVHVKVGPLDGLGTTHLDVQHAADGRILHPRDAVVRQEVVVTQHGEHDALRVNHQYACRCADGIVL